MDPNASVLIETDFTCYKSLVLFLSDYMGQIPSVLVVTCNMGLNSSVLVESDNMAVKSSVLVLSDNMGHSWPVLVLRDNVGPNSSVLVVSDNMGLNSAVLIVTGNTSPNSTVLFLAIIWIQIHQFWFRAVIWTKIHQFWSWAIKLVSLGRLLAYSLGGPTATKWPSDASCSEQSLVQYKEIVLNVKALKWTLYTSIEMLHCSLLSSRKISNLFVSQFVRFTLLKGALSEVIKMQCSLKYEWACLFVFNTLHFRERSV